MLTSHWRPSINPVPCGRVWQHRPRQCRCISWQPQLQPINQLYLMHLPALARSLHHAVWSILHAVLALLGVNCNCCCPFLRGATSQPVAVWMLLPQQLLLHRALLLPIHPLHARAERHMDTAAAAAAGHPYTQQKLPSADKCAANGAQITDAASKGWLLPPVRARWPVAPQQRSQCWLAW